MLLHPTLEKLTAMRFSGMAAALEEQMKMDGLNDIGFEERLGLLLDHEQAVRETRQLKTRLRKAKLRQDGSVEDIDFRHPRGLDKSLVLRLSECQWIKDHNNLIIIGPTGVGKSFISSALGNQACHKGFKVLYFNTQKLFTRLKMSKADGTYMREINRIEKQDLLVLDDFGLQEMDTQTRMAFLEIIEDRFDIKSTIISSQLPVSKWYDVIGEGTIADAILDRVVNGAHRIDLKGESLRKKK